MTDDSTKIASPTDIFADTSYKNSSQSHKNCIIIVKHKTTTQYIK